MLAMYNKQQYINVCSLRKVLQPSVIAKNQKADNMLDIAGFFASTKPKSIINNASIMQTDHDHQWLYLEGIKEYCAHCGDERDNPHGAVCACGKEWHHTGRHGILSAIPPAKNYRESDSDPAITNIRSGDSGQLSNPSGSTM